VKQLAAFADSPHLVDEALHLGFPQVFAQAQVRGERQRLPHRRLRRVDVCSTTTKVKCPQLRFHHEGRHILEHTPPLPQPLPPPPKTLTLSLLTVLLHVAGHPRKGSLLLGVALRQVHNMASEGGCQRRHT